MTAFFDRNGVQVPLLTWACLFEERSYRLVARCKVASAGSAYLVVTIWTGYDKDLFNPRGQIYSTGVFVATNRSSATLDEVWSTTEANALRAHDQAVRDLCARLVDPVITSQPVVPARPRAGWAVQRSTRIETP